MIWLALDTATPIAVVAVVADGRVLAAVELTETRRHAENLIGAIDQALGQAAKALDDVAGIAVGRGPGSFIGVRTGIATAKGLALGRRVPLVGVSTLVGVAAGVSELPSGRGLVTLDAKRGEVYAAVIENTPDEIVLLEAPAAIAPEEATRRAGALEFLVGSGVVGGIARVGPSPLGLARALSWRLRAGVADEIEDIVPDYARAPDARLPTQPPVARPLRPGPS